MELNNKLATLICGALIAIGIVAIKTQVADEEAHKTIHKLEQLYSHL